ncbi:MAG: CRISPR repeat RNA endoribonuclease Cas6 [uncultured Sulfurovum sp.]|uniref:CRISPR repeat RNA endoribonuclease Cas6 n=1 Tax=uncultured Sulfurovum sp. TaxID=269237 RepID=A0A6S6TIM2_9BACT|nr:MAG: CRISPR repeat RNA endoribonuclease Cas6 [uncultured Sulfurovum sp.]
MKYHKIEVKIKTNHKPSYFIGSMIRGAMGHALKKVTCINPSYQCEGCFAQSSCLYYDFYEKKNSFHKYRFNIELGSNKFDFGLYLFDEACDGLPYVLSALEMTLTQMGLTKYNYKFSDFKVYLNNQSIYENNGFTSFDILPKTFQIDSFCPNIKIRLQTPLRIKKSNKFLRDNVDIEDILRSIYQREQEVFYGKKVFKLNYEPSYVADIKLLKYEELQRQSNRQNKRMNMDGTVGEIAVMGIDEQSYKLLKLGEVLGVGKQTVLGLGKIEVEDLK